MDRSEARARQRPGDGDGLAALREHAWLEPAPGAGAQGVRQGLSSIRCGTGKGSEPS